MQTNANNNNSTRALINIYYYYYLYDDDEGCWDYSICAHNCHHQDSEM